MQATDILMQEHEVILRVRHCLLANPGTTLSQVRRVMPHPQGLAQCERYIRTKRWEAVVAYDTAGAAFTQLQVLLPGETAAPGTTTGKLGTPRVQTGQPTQARFPTRRS